MSKILPNALKELIRDIWQEIKEIPNDRQRLAAKLDAIFGLLATLVVLLLFLGTFSDKALKLLGIVMGHEIPSTDQWIVLIALISLLVYFLVCIQIVRK